MEVNNGFEYLTHNREKANGTVLSRICSLPEFLYTAQTEHFDHDDGKHRSRRQRLKSFARIGASSEPVFLSTTTGISSGPVALEVERREMKDLKSPTVILILGFELCVR